MNGKNIVKYWYERVIVETKVIGMLVVQTDLELDATKPNYDADKLSDLIARINKTLKNYSGTIDEARIIPSP